MYDWGRGRVQLRPFKEWLGQAWFSGTEPEDRPNTWQRRPSTHLHTHMSTISSLLSIRVVFQARVLKKSVRSDSCSFDARRLRLRSVEGFSYGFWGLGFILSGLHVSKTQVPGLSSLTTPNFAIEKCNCMEGSGLRSFELKPFKPLNTQGLQKSSVLKTWSAPLRNSRGGLKRILWFAKYAVI